MSQVVNEQEPLNAQILAAIKSSGELGITPAGLREIMPGIKQKPMQRRLEWLVFSGRAYRTGTIKTLRFFHHSLISDSLLTHSEKTPKREVPGSIADNIRKTISAAGENGVTMEQIADILTEWPRGALRDAVYKQAKMGFVYLIGPKGRKLYFLSSIPREVAEKRMKEYVAKARAESQARDKRVRAERMQAKRAQQPKRQRVVTAMRKKTASINKLADKFRGTALPKERAKPAPTVTIPAGLLIQQCPTYRDYRYEPDPAHFGGLSKLPIGVYAEPAGAFSRAVLGAQ